MLASIAYSLDLLYTENITLENYTKLCTIDIDLENIPRHTAKDSAGGNFYRVYYDIVLIFGLTELRAQIAWLDANVRISVQICLFACLLTIITTSRRQSICM